MLKNHLPFLAIVAIFLLYQSAELKAQVTVTATAGTTAASYTTISDAFVHINNGTHKGDITVKLGASISESTTAVLNASGSGSASYNGINIYPTAAGVEISANLEAPLIQLNGADYVTIDGRVNMEGTTATLQLINTSASTVAGTSTVSFVGDAMGNVLSYCNVKGSSLCTGSGIIYFGVGSTAGNDNNTINNCNITNRVTRPINALFSSSTEGARNSQNMIYNNNFYDVFNAGYDSYGIKIGTGNAAWSIIQNSFYETVSLAPTASVAYYGIYILDGEGTLFNISNNYIGGSAATCSGTLTKTNSNDNTFYGIYINAGGSSSADWSNVNGNIIKNISWSNSGSAPFYGIYSPSAYLNIGTLGGGNTIGASSGNGSITYTAGADGGSCYGIYFNGGLHVSVVGNTVGSMTANNVSWGTNLYGIYCAGSNTATGNTLSGNTVVNLLSNSTGSGTLVNGIFVALGKNTLTGNTVSGITNAGSNNTASTHLLSAGGIVVYNSTAAAQTITGNTIHGISSTPYNFPGSVAGIYYSGPSTSGTVSGNFIYDISATGGGSSGNVYGIKADAGPATWSNNIISLSSNTRSHLYGFFDNGGASNTHLLYFNTVSFSFVLNVNQSSYGYYSAANTNTRDIRDNIFYNARSGHTADVKQYGAFYSSVGGTLTTNYNDYHITGTGGNVGYYNGDRATLAIWQTATGQDGNSTDVNPNFINGGSSTASDYFPQTSLSGTTISGITTDYFGFTRASTPSMGAVEGQAVVTWTGITSEDWSGTTNWDRSMVPLVGQNVTIPSGTTYSPHVTTAPSSYSECNNLTIQSGAILTIDAGKALSVYGTLTNGSGTAGLVLASSGAEAGMLYHTTSGVSASVQRYIAAPASWSDISHGWHLLSSPVASQSIDPGFINATPENYDFYAWWEPTNQWVNYKNTTTAPVWNTANVLNGTGGEGAFIPGKGYLVAYAASGTKTFTGTLNISDIPVSGLSYTSSSSYKGFNLLGNPFSCPIAWNATGNTWNLSNIDANCQIWVESGGSYTIKTPDQLIPVANGFMVHVSSAGTGSLTIPASSRRLSASSWVKSENRVENKIVLKAVDLAGQTFQETVIAFDPNATEGFDPLYDSYFLAGYAPKFFSVSDKVHYALNGLPSMMEHPVIPLHFIKNMGSEFYIELVSSIPGKEIWLTDLKTNQIQNLNLNPIYPFTSSPEDFEERFQLSFNPTGMEQWESPEAAIYCFGNQLQITGKEPSMLDIFNISGQRVHSEEIDLSFGYTRKLNFPKGYYLVRLTGKNSVVTRKVWIDRD